MFALTCHAALQASCKPWPPLYVLVEAESMKSSHRVRRLGNAWALKKINFQKR